ncbi:MAG: aspartate/tyrosine/aromatic aminotransferase [Gammaproteobacteria bacterium]|nr:MAG: aspartate/tyrosine/aromatic aminotransferase [Gammaproteobacteria bacterium]TND06904.1 MAG: aspartate/tyrosine/aromatic aminotransferase [Gammaproteobacteria bacterium]
MIPTDSYAFANQLLEEAGVAITPGKDFGCHNVATHVWFADTTSVANLLEGMQRIRNFV